MPMLPGSQVVTVGAASVQFGAAMLGSTQYTIISTTACWVCVDVNPTAVAAAAGNFFLPANYPITIQALGPQNKVAVIQAAAGGSATLTQTL